jgi:hypothetical protein
MKKKKKTAKKLRWKMSEPRLEDDIALGLDEEELDDGYLEPDRMWGDE